MLPIIAMEHDVRIIQDETIVRAVHDITGITVDRDRLVLALTKASAFYEEGYRAGKKAADVVDVDKAMKFLEDYAFKDEKEFYTNGTILVPLFRVKQAFVDKAYNGFHVG